MAPKAASRRERFVAEYIKSGNGTQAAIAAGFSKKGAHVQAGRLLRNATICSAIEAARAPVLGNAQITLESHMAELDRLSKAAEHAGQFGPAVKAAESRGKVAGFYVERHAGADGKGPIAVEVTRRIVKA